MVAATCVTCTGGISIKLSRVGTVGIVFGFYLTLSRCVGAAVALRVTELGHELALIRIWSSAVAVA